MRSCDFGGGLSNIDSVLCWRWRRWSIWGRWLRRITSKPSWNLPSYMCIGAAIHWIGRSRKERSRIIGVRCLLLSYLWIYRLMKERCRRTQVLSIVAWWLKWRWDCPKRCGCRTAICFLRFWVWRSVCVIWGFSSSCVVMRKFRWGKRWMRVRRGYRCSIEVVFHRKRWQMRWKEECFIEWRMARFLVWL